MRSISGVDLSMIFFPIWKSKNLNGNSILTSTKTLFVEQPWYFYCSNMCAVYRKLSEKLFQGLQFDWRVKLTIVGDTNPNIIDIQRQWVCVFKTNGSNIWWIFKEPFPQPWLALCLQCLLLIETRKAFGLGDFLMIISHKMITINVGVVLKISEFFIRLAQLANAKSNWVLFWVLALSSWV